MAKRKITISSSLLPDSPSPNESSGAQAQQAKPELRKIAPANYSDHPRETLVRTQLLEQHSGEYTLQEAELLMRSVQAAQKDLTETLNHLSSFRKVVARIIEFRRREAAALKKAKGSNPLVQQTIITGSFEEPGSEKANS